MKNILILLSFLISLGNINAQNEESNGAIILGGYFNFTVQKKQLPFPGTGLGLSGVSYASNPTDALTTDFTIEPILGKEFTQHWIFGIKLNYRNRIFKSNSTTLFGSSVLVDIKSTRDNFGTGLFARYTFNPSKKIIFFLQPYVEANSSTDIYKVDNEISREDKIQFLQIGADLGILYNLNKKFRVTANTSGISFTTGKWKDVTNDEMDNFVIFNTRFRFSSISLGIEMRL